MVVKRLSDEKGSKNDNVPTLASNHYFLFAKDFDGSSCAEAMTFILER